MNEQDVSLWEALGLSPDSGVEPVPEDVWTAALTAAVDPAADPVDSSLVPVSDGPSDLGDEEETSEFGGWAEDDVDAGDDTPILEDIDLGYSGESGLGGVDETW